MYRIITAGLLITLTFFTMIFYNIGNINVDNKYISFHEMSITHSYGQFMLKTDLVEIVSDYVYDNGKVKDIKICNEIATHIINYSFLYDFDLSLLVALIETETHFEPEARSTYGASGLTQVVYRIWDKKLKEWSIAEEESDLYCIDKSIEAGISVFYEIDSKYNSNHGQFCETLDWYSNSSSYKHTIYRNILKFDQYYKSRIEAK